MYVERPLDPPDQGPLPEGIEALELLYGSLNPSHKKAAIEVVADDIFDSISDLIKYTIWKDPHALLSVMTDVLTKAGNCQYAQDKVEEMIDD